MLFHFFLNTVCKQLAIIRLFIARSLFVIYRTINLKKVNTDKFKCQLRQLTVYWSTVKTLPAKLPRTGENVSKLIILMTNSNTALTVHPVRGTQEKITSGWSSLKSRRIPGIILILYGDVLLLCVGSRLGSAKKRLMQKSWGRKVKHAWRFVRAVEVEVFLNRGGRHLVTAY